MQLLFRLADMDGELLHLADKAGMKHPELSCALMWSEGGQQRRQTLTSNIMGVGSEILARLRENVQRMAQEFWEEREAALHICSLRWHYHGCRLCGEEYITRDEEAGWCGACWEEE